MLYCHTATQLLTNLLCHLLKLLWIPISPFSPGTSLYLADYYRLPQIYSLFKKLSTIK